MPAKWRRSFRQWRDFARAHPEIKIAPQTVSVPRDLKSAFYGLFNETRAAFLRACLPRLRAEVEALAGAIREARRRVLERLGLEEIVMSSELAHFLEDPTDRLVREMFDPLFDLLKGGVDVGEFEATTARRIKSLYEDLYRLSFQKWVMLALVDLTGADENFAVEAPLLEMSARGPTVDLNLKPLPKPRASKRLSLVKQNMAALVVPDLIIHSAEVDGYLSFCSALDEAVLASDVLWTAAEVDAARQWRPTRLWRGTLGLSWAVAAYVDDALDRTALVADSHRLARPEVVIEFSGPEEDVAEAFQRAALYRDELEPKRGVFVVSPKKVSPSQAQPLDEGLILIEANLDESRLAPLAQALISRRPSGVKSSPP